MAHTIPAHFEQPIEPWYSEHNVGLVRRESYLQWRRHWRYELKNLESNIRRLKNSIKPYLYQRRDNGKGNMVCQRIGKNPNYVGDDMVSYNQMQLHYRRERARHMHDMLAEVRQLYYSRVAKAA